MNLKAGFGALISMLILSFIAAREGLNDWRKVGLIFIILGMFMITIIILKIYIDDDRT